MTRDREASDKQRKELTLRKGILIPRVTTEDLDVQFSTSKSTRGLWK